MVIWIFSLYEAHLYRYDEFNNYYNADGQPDAPPRFNNNRRQDNYGISLGISGTLNIKDDDYDPADDFANEYEQEDDDGDDEHMGHYDNIYLNIGKEIVVKKGIEEYD